MEEEPKQELTPLSRQIVFRINPCFGEKQWRTWGLTNAEAVVDVPVVAVAVHEHTHGLPERDSRAGCTRILRWWDEPVLAPRIC